MKITHFERTVVRVPFEPGIVTDEFWEVRDAYPETLDRRCHDVCRLHTDAGLVGLGMSDPYYDERADTSPEEWLGREPESFESGDESLASCHSIGVMLSGCGRSSGQCTRTEDTPTPACVGFACHKGGRLDP